VSAGVPAFARVVVPVVLVVFGAGFAAVVRRAADGRLPRNNYAGIRIPGTLRDDEGWLAGHRAAQGSCDVAGAGMVVAGVLTPWVDDLRWFLSWVLVAVVWSMVWIGRATVRASRAARLQ
jgi:hypothetical protein